MRGTPSTRRLSSGQRPQAVLACGPWPSPSVALAIWRLAAFGRLSSNSVLDVDARVPDLEVAHGGEAAHRLAVLAHGGERRAAPLRLVRDPRSRPATATLAASRLTSHSNGPGRVSSKSLRSKTSRRSGASNTPKFERWASPQSCAVRPDRGRAGQVGRHHRGRAPEEGERRGEHPAVADRHELRDARLVLLRQDPPWRRPIRGGRPVPVARPRRPPARLPPARGALRDRGVVPARPDSGVLLRQGHARASHGARSARNPGAGGERWTVDIARRRPCSCAETPPRRARDRAGCLPASRHPPAVSGRPLIIEKRKWDGSVSARWTALFHRDGARLTWRTPVGTTRSHPRTGRQETTEHLEVSATCGDGWIATAVLDADGRLRATRLTRPRATRPSAMGSSPSSISTSTSSSVTTRRS